MFSGQSHDSQTCGSPGMLPGIAIVYHNSCENSVLQPLVGVFTNQRYELVGENTDHRLKNHATHQLIPCLIQSHKPLQQQQIRGL